MECLCTYINEKSWNVEHDDASSVDLWYEVDIIPPLHSPSSSLCPDFNTNMGLHAPVQLVDYGKSTT